MPGDVTNSGVGAFDEALVRKTGISSVHSRSDDACVGPVWIIDQYHEEGIMNPQCMKPIYGVWFGRSQCEKRGTVQLGRLWFCTIHSPAYLATQRQKKNERWAKNDLAIQQQEAERQRVADLVRACEQLGIRTVEELHAKVKS